MSRPRLAPACGAAQTAQPFPVELTGFPRTRLGQPPERMGLVMARQAFCRGCGAGIHEQAPLCPHCGAPQSAAARVTAQKSKVVAALLAVFLGGIGMHKFYLGEVGLGIIYFLFCWTFIPSLIGLIEGIVYITSTDEAFARRYG